MFYYRCWRISASCAVLPSAARACYLTALLLCPLSIFRCSQAIKLHLIGKRIKPLFPLCFFLPAWHAHICPLFLFLLLFFPRSFKIWPLVSLSRTQAISTSCLVSFICLKCVYAFSSVYIPIHTQHVCCCLFVCVFVAMPVLHMVCQKTVLSESHKKNGVNGEDTFSWERHIAAKRGKRGRHFLMRGTLLLYPY